MPPHTFERLLTQRSDESVVLIIDLFVLLNLFVLLSFNIHVGTGACQCHQHRIVTVVIGDDRNIQVLSADVNEYWRYLI